MEKIKEIPVKGTLIRVIKGDLTESDVDAIVNAANSYLQHGGGVAGAIVRKGGSIIQEESNRIGFCPVGSAVITSAGRLKARYVIHTVGPRWGEGDEENKLKSAVKNTLLLADEKGFKSISIPAISAGIFGFPKDRCAEIICGETVNFIKGRETSLKEINFFLIDDEMIGYFTKEMDRFKPEV
ncbi:MAG TPA: macro domain-containing protein [Syntrophorhabdaceae bacterium]|nr:macro domain-containing protein [Syntrophorhabdaceae bacterium]HOL06022.1 macro domain-containing protein [Syntrophorhabdaceae bacterium]HON85124.1 macro domain-containing protein [Syntrophorhabdaceae bacterium]HOT41279.1 macro domain-containing protein [Syntrophorhabdaceae bacterium]HPC66718.1 macro domain-containing protein [Syntrophorhabdaceae bacterium]